MDEKTLRLVAFHMADKMGADLDTRLSDAQKIYDFLTGNVVEAAVPGQPATVEHPAS